MPRLCPNCHGRETEQYSDPLSDVAPVCNHCHQCDSFFFDIESISAELDEAENLEEMEIK